MEHRWDKTGIKLYMPADAKWQLVVRMALSGAGALLGLSVDLLDDLRCLADEACNCLLNQPNKMKSLALECFEQDEKLHVHFIGERTEEEQDVSELDGEVVKCILETLSIDTNIVKDKWGAWKVEAILPIREQ